MELGTLQKAWIKSLRENPERQSAGSLGFKKENGEDYNACCLGELLCVKARLEGKELPFDKNGRLCDDIYDKVLSNSTVEETGLRSDIGDMHKIYYTKYSTLAGMNDNGVKWPEIADFIEANPKSVFIKSV